MLHTDSYFVNSEHIEFTHAEGGSGGSAGRRECREECREEGGREGGRGGGREWIAHCGTAGSVWVFVAATSITNRDPSLRAPRSNR